MTYSNSCTDEGKPEVFSYLREIQVENNRRFIAPALLDAFIAVFCEAFPEGVKRVRRGKKTGNIMVEEFDCLVIDLSYFVAGRYSQDLHIMFDCYFAPFFAELCDHMPSLFPSTKELQLIIGNLFRMYGIGKDIYAFVMQLMWMATVNQFYGYEALECVATETVAACPGDTRRLPTKHIVFRVKSYGHSTCTE